MRWPENIKLTIGYKVYDEISKFYNNVGYKYLNTYGREEINNLIDKKFSPLLNVNKNKLLSDPYLNKWKGYGRIVVDKWNFAIDIKDNKAIIVDACHAQNMHNKKTLIDLFEKDLQGRTARIQRIQIINLKNEKHYYRLIYNKDSQ